ncbi:MAG: HD family hydrolase [Campylobacterota bacterium]
MPGGNFMTTISGKKIVYDNLDPHDIDITDIAHALSNICRFGGHINRFYSVAQHSVMVSKMVPKHLALAALLHDASEAYLSDIVRPAKRMLPQYKELELKLQRVIEERFAVTFDHKEIHIADNRALYAEAEHFYGDISDWGLDNFVWDAVIVPFFPEESRLMFMHRFNELAFEGWR